MLRHIGCSATVLTAQCQTLQHAQRNQDNGSGNTNGCVVGQDANNEGGQTHDQNSHQEGVFATNHVTQAAEHQRAEGTHDETGSKRQQRENEG